ncbi:MAG TPA: hypothetical protein VMR45_03735 [Patescibacteria group bacterium]|jgi:hypothetical protein|nr:hypothetical protein [Patescibacteria group bacterium]
MQNKTPVIISKPNDLARYIKTLFPRIITIDGVDGSGKSTLSKELHKVLGGTLLDEETYSVEGVGYFVPETKKLKSDIAPCLKKLPIIYESCFMEEILKTIGLKPDLRIYIKEMSQMDGWGYEYSLDCKTEDEAVKEIQQSIPNGLKANAKFDIQMVKYHYQFRPHENADIIYHRQKAICRH